jgi:succinate dehydrogenase/fumarate reductase flavoprotein subunit
MLRQFPGQSQPRNLFVKGGGVGLVSQLFKACKAHGNIQIVDDFFVTGLLKGCAAGENSVVGAVGLNLKSGDLTLISAKAVVLATGGCQWLWEINDCPADATGDGVAYAYRAGAQLVDMEMILFYPSVIIWPPSLKGAFVHYEFLDPAILDGNVYDKEGRAVLPKPLPVRDEAMQLMQQAIREGRGTAHGGLLWYVGDSSKGAEAVQRTLNIAQYNYIKAHGVNPAADKIEVAPGAHYLLGGIHIDEKCQTSVKGLFATPECAGNFDGANRLAGSGITATQVFGARAGFHAHAWAATTQYQEAAADSVEEETERVAARITGGNARPSNIYCLKDKLRAAAQLYAGVNRDQDGLQHLVKISANIRRELSYEKVQAVTYNQQLVDLLQLDSMSELAGLIAGSALQRQESRGHHYRTDFPRQDDANWITHTCVMKGSEGPVFGVKPVIKI